MSKKQKQQNHGKQIEDSFASYAEVEVLKMSRDFNKQQIQKNQKNDK